MPPLPSLASYRHTSCYSPCFLVHHRCRNLYKLKAVPSIAKQLQLALLQYSLYCGSLEPSPQYLWGMPALWLRVLDCLTLISSPPIFSQEPCFSIFQYLPFVEWTPTSERAKGPEEVMAPSLKSNSHVAISNSGLIANFQGQFYPPSLSLTRTQQKLIQNESLIYLETLRKETMERWGQVRLVPLQLSQRVNHLCAPLCAS